MVHSVTVQHDHAAYDMFFFFDLRFGLAHRERLGVVDAFLDEFGKLIEVFQCLDLRIVLIAF